MPIDPGLNFDNTEKAFASAMQFAPLVKIGTRLTPWAIKSGLPIKGLIKNTLFQQFVGGESLEKTDGVLTMLKQFSTRLTAECMSVGLKAKKIWCVWTLAQT